MITPENTNQSRAYDFYNNLETAHIFQGIDIRIVCGRIPQLHSDLGRGFYQVRYGTRHALSVFRGS